MRALGSTVLLGLSLCVTDAWAQPAKLVSLDPAHIQGIAPLLKSSDLVLFESEAKGSLRQVTTLIAVAAPPLVVRDAVLHPERNSSVVKSLTRSEVKPVSADSFDYYYELDYRVVTLSGILRFQQLAGTGAAPINVFDPEPGGQSRARWEFLPFGGGTILAIYGYTDVNHSAGVVNRLVTEVPQLEHGLALMSQLQSALTVRTIAEKLTPTPPPMPAAGATNYDALLSRGTIVLLRRQPGQFTQLSLIRRSNVPAAALVRAASEPLSWPGKIPTIRAARPMPDEDGMAVAAVEQSLPLLSFSSVFGVRREPTVMDMMGLRGELRGARLRWDIRTTGSESQVVLRTMPVYSQSSILLRQLYRLEPYFQCGVDVGLSLLLVDGVHKLAETLR